MAVYVNVGKNKSEKNGKKNQTLGVYVKMVNNCNKHYIGRFCVRFLGSIWYLIQLYSIPLKEKHKMWNRNESSKIV